MLSVVAIESALVSVCVHRQQLNRTLAQCICQSRPVRQSCRAQALLVRVCVCVSLSVHCPSTVRSRCPCRSDLTLSASCVCERGRQRERSRTGVKEDCNVLPAMTAPTTLGDLCVWLHCIACLLACLRVVDKRDCLRLSLSEASARASARWLLISYRSIDCWWQRRQRAEGVSPSSLVLLVLLALSSRRRNTCSVGLSRSPTQPRKQCTHSRHMQARLCLEWSTITTKPSTRTSSMASKDAARATLTTRSRGTRRGGERREARKNQRQVRFWSVGRSILVGRRLDRALAPLALVTATKATRQTLSE